jgi:SAM-dependent methyltransferase
METSRWFGDNSVVDTERLRYLVHGDMIHGAQYLDEARRDCAVPYFLPSGPVSDIVETVDEQKPVGVVGLGAGGLATFAHEGQAWTYFEIDPEIVEIARNDFSFLENSAGEVGIVLGDGRLGVRASPPAHFGLIVVDAFIGDAVPTHLVTREAIETYLQRLLHGGLLVFHVSNKYVDLRPILVNTADSLERQLSVRVAVHHPGSDDRYSGLFVEPTAWVVMGAPGGPIEALADGSRWRRGETDTNYPVANDSLADRMPIMR